MSNREFWERLDCLFQADRLAEEALSTEALRSERVTETDKLLRECGLRTVSDMLAETCKQLVSDMRGVMA